MIACGMPVKESLDAAETLRKEGFSVGVLDMATIKPLDREAVLCAAHRSRLVMTVEEHNIIGGLGAAVAETLSEVGVSARLVRHGIRDEYSLIAPPNHLYAHYKLDAPGIETVARSALEAVST
jgi:transketolase